jgi:hypothetical protein
MTEPVDMAIYHELRAACLAVFERHGIPRDCVNGEMLISRSQVRNAVIRKEYRDGNQPGESASRRAEIAAKHGMSPESVNNILYEKIATPL